MSIQVFHPEDEIDNLLRGLSLLENAVRGVANTAEHSEVTPEDLEPIVMLTEALQDHVRNIQRIIGGVVFKEARPPAQMSCPAQP